MTPIEMLRARVAKDIAKNPRKCEVCGVLKRLTILSSYTKTVNTCVTIVC